MHASQILVVVRLPAGPFMIVQVSDCGYNLVLELKVPHGILFIVLIQYGDLSFPAGYAYEVHGFIEILNTQHLGHLIIPGTIELRQHTWLEELKSCQNRATLRVKDIAMTLGIPDVQNYTPLRSAVPPSEAREGKILRMR